jgi:hypothetical protein
VASQAVTKIVGRGYWCLIAPSRVSRDERRVFDGGLRREHDQEASDDHEASIVPNFIVTIRNAKRDRFSAGSTAHRPQIAGIAAEV